MPPRVYILRSTVLRPKAAGLWLLALLGCLSAASFVGGFAASRSWIDRGLADSTEVLNRSVHAYEAEQTLLFRQWADSYTQLSHRMAALPERKEVADHGR